MTQSLARNTIQNYCTCILGQWDSKCWSRKGHFTALQYRYYCIAPYSTVLFSTSAVRIDNATVHKNDEHPKAES